MALSLHGIEGRSYVMNNPPGKGGCSLIWDSDSADSSEGDRRSSREAAESRGVGGRSGANRARGGAVAKTVRYPVDGFGRVVYEFLGWNFRLKELS